MLYVLGSINADLLFRVEALPAPGETVLCPTYVTAPGGKGANQAAAAAKAGGAVAFLGHVGKDAHGSAMAAHLRAAGVDCSSLEESAAKPTALAVIGVDAEGENAIIVASAANLDTHAGQLERAALGAGATLLCQNEIPSVETHAALLRAKAAGARTIWNLAPAGSAPDAVLDALDVLIVNQLEAAALLGGAGEPAAMAATLAARHDLVCVLTLGGAGALCVARGEALRCPPLAIEPIDTTGAGDAFAGVLAAALDGGAALDDALRRASVGAALACEQLGAQSAQADAAAIAERLDDLPAIERAPL